uniref:uncharacterized protein LOC113474097 n=1 Tax=Ciona intestinalis TaxID=7719 RepID=UPI000EF45BBB|nr:uncharacterized protein LOC113474097 [Ciona intestinalis]|eukprot:XP_026689482.1 uncharacterized protein LOC113474097 [Ciona intestinalis]
MSRPSRLEYSHHCLELVDDSSVEECQASQTALNQRRQLNSFNELNDDYNSVCSHQDTANKRTVVATILTSSSKAMQTREDRYRIADTADQHEHNAYENVQAEFYAFARAYFDEEKYDDAQRALEKLLPCACGSLLLQVKIAIVRCMLGKRATEDIGDLVHDLVRENEAVSCWDKAKVIEQLRLLSQKLSSCGVCEEALKVLKYCAESTQCISDPNKRLFELVETAGAIQHVCDCDTDAFHYCKTAEEILQLLDAIYRQVSNIKEVNKKFKCRQTVWCLKYFGYCCNRLGKYRRSVNVHKHAIQLMERLIAMSLLSIGCRLSGLADK